MLTSAPPPPLAWVRPSRDRPPRAKDGLAMVDDGAPDGVRRFWFPALAASAAAPAADAAAEHAAAAQPEAAGG